MKIRSKLLISGISVFFILFASLVEAEVKKFNFGLTAGISSWPSDVFKYRRVYTEPYFSLYYRGMYTLKQDVHLKTLFNLYFQYNLSQYFGLQGEIGHQEADYEVLFSLVPLDPSLPARTERHNLGWSFTSVFLHAVFRARKSEEYAVPYGFIGLGFCAVRGKAEVKKGYRVEVQSQTDLGLKAGAGVTFSPPGNLPLGLDLKVFVLVLGPSTFGYYSPYGGSEVITGGYNLILGVEIGLKFRL